MSYNSTIGKPKFGRECSHPTCGSTCRREKSEPKQRVPIKRGSSTPRFDRDELTVWFNKVRGKMTGVCRNCGGKSCRDSDKYFTYSIAHILPKAYFPSIATNEFNFIELCHFGQSCHAQMDNKMIDLIDMACWDEIVTKFCKMYPKIAKEERRRIPNVLLQYIETEI